MTKLHCHLVGILRRIDRLDTPQVQSCHVVSELTLLAVSFPRFFGSRPRIRDRVAANGVIMEMFCVAAAMLLS